MALIAQILSKFDDSGIKKATKSFGGLKHVIGAVGLGLGLHELVDAAKIAAKDAKSFDLLATQMKRNAHATDDQVKSTDDLLTQLSVQDGILKADLYPSMLKFANVTHNVSKAQTLLKLGLNASALSGKPLTAVTAALSKAYMGNTKSLIRMFPELKNSKNAIADLTKEADGAAQQKADVFSVFSAQMEAMQVQIGNVVLPVLKTLMDILLMPGVKETVLTLAAIVAVVKTLSVVTGVFNVIIGILTGEMIVLDGALTAMGWTLIIAAVLALMAGIAWLATKTTFFQTVWSYMVANFMGGVKFMVDAWNMIKTGFSIAFDFISNMFKGYVNFWVSLFEGFINGIINGINGMLGGLNSILDGVKTASGGTIDMHVNTIPNLKLPKLAKGGIVMPTPGGRQVTVGEGNSAEAIIPLNGRNGFGNTINIHVHSADPKAVVDAVSKYVKANGVLPSNWKFGY